MAKAPAAAERSARLRVQRLVDKVGLACSFSRMISELLVSVNRLSG